MDKVVWVPVTGVAELALEDIVRDLTLDPARGQTVPLPGYICGGAIRDAFAAQDDADGEVGRLAVRRAIKDVDVFFRSESDFDQFCRILESRSNTVKVFQSAHAVTYSVACDNPLIGKMQVQACRIAFGEPEELVLRFDFTHAQGFLDLLCRSQEGRPVLSAQAIQAIRQKRSVFVPEAYRPSHSLYRLVKFAGRGYKATREEVAKVLAAVLPLMPQKDTPVTSAEILGIIGGNYGHGESVAEQYSTEA